MDYSRIDKIPQSINECIEILEISLSHKEKEIIENLTEMELLQTHFEIGLFIRNNWVYNEDCNLRQSFGWRVHDDDISRIILNAFRLFLKKEDYIKYINKNVITK